MTDHFNLVTKQFLPRFVETIHLGIHLQTQIIVIHTVETVDCISPHIIRCRRIITLLYLAHIPTLGIVKRRHDIDIFE